MPLARGAPGKPAKPVALRTGHDMADATSTEAQLRDKLSKRLDILEPGLSLRSTEYRLANDHGSHGRIDILATDQYGATVIIELKKSNQTARQALHELNKYVGLLKYDHGLRDSKIRCMLVSTEWHELLVPFSEFSRMASWTVDGYRLCLTDAGLPDRAEKIVPVAPPAELRLCPEHKVYLFADQSRRDAALPPLLDILRNHNLSEHLILKLDTKRRKAEEGYCFALYLIVPEFDPEERKRAREWLATTHWADELDEPIRFLEEQLVIAEVTDAFFDHCDDREIGYPEKLANVCRDWEVVTLIRGGPRLESQTIFSDEYLLRWAKGLDGGNAAHFDMIATPQRRLAWNEAKTNAAYCLKGNHAWESLVRAYLDEIERKNPYATVTARFYNPCNLMMSLYRVAKWDVGDMLATAEMMISDKDGTPFRMVLGAMVWNGKKVTAVREVLPDDVSTLFDLYMAGALDGGPWAAEEHLIARHGLSYVMVECTPSTEGGVLKQLVIKDGALTRLSVNEDELQDFGAFYRAHRGYLRSLVEDFDSWASFG
jgi:hypothetical protein